MYKGEPQKLWHTPTSATGLCLHPHRPLDGKLRAGTSPAPGTVSRHGAGRRTPVPWSYLLLAKLLPALPSSSRNAQQKRSFGVLSCLQADDLVLEVKGRHQGFLWSELSEGSFSLSAHQQWQCGLYRVCSVTGEGQGLFHESKRELRSSCRNLPAPSAASARYSPAGGFIPLQLHPLPYNCELPLLPAITLHCLICSRAKSLVSKSCGSEFWRLFTHFLCPVTISCLSSFLLW